MLIKFRIKTAVHNDIPKTMNIEANVCYLYASANGK